MNYPMAEKPSPAVTTTPSAITRERMQVRRGERKFVAGWIHVLMTHFELEASALQRGVPFQLDLWPGRAFVSLVAFTMQGMRPVVGGKWTAWLFRPIAAHGFLNVRTYVRHNDERGALLIIQRIFTSPTRLEIIASNSWATSLPGIQIHLSSCTCPSARHII